MNNRDTRVNRLTITQCKQLLEDRIIPYATYTTLPDVRSLEGIRRKTKDGLHWNQFVRCHLTHLTDIGSVGPKHPIMELPKGEEWKLAKELCPKVLVHHLSWRANSTQDIANMDVSHLCGNRKCFDINHLTLESHADNMARVGCHGYLLLVYNGTIHQEVTCEHNPPCRKVRVVQLDGPIHRQVQ